MRRTGEEAIVEIQARHRGGSARRNAHGIHSSGNRNSSSNYQDLLADADGRYREAKKDSTRSLGKQKCGRKIRCGRLKQTVVQLRPDFRVCT